MAKYETRSRSSVNQKTIVNEWKDVTSDKKCQVINTYTGRGKFTNMEWSLKKSRKR